MSNVFYLFVFKLYLYGLRASHPDQIASPPSRLLPLTSLLRLRIRRLVIHCWSLLFNYVGRNSSRGLYPLCSIVSFFGNFIGGRKLMQE